MASSDQPAPAERVHRHPTTLVEVGDWREEIDVDIAPLVRELWIAGIATMMSCQGDEGGTVWIAFDDATMLVRFLNLAAEFDLDPKSIYNRICRQFPVDDEEQAWGFGFLPDDAAFYLGEDERVRESGPTRRQSTDVFVVFSVWFPRADLEPVLDRVRRHNDRALRAAS